jgi:phosphoserine aminotransferase
MISRNNLNFSGGPGALPESVLQQVQASIIEVPETGLSILGISHRSEWFAEIVQELEDNIRTLLGLPKNFHVLFLQGGATQQFSMAPMSFLRGKTQAAQYIRSGYWSAKSIPEAMREGPVEILWNGEPEKFGRLPEDHELHYASDAPYLHYVSNETVEGLQFKHVLGREDVPRICDMSSDFLSKPCEAERFSLIYAHAQKNLGPAGVTIVILRDDFLQQAPHDLPDFLNYHRHVETHSIFNTPPVFAIYVVLLVTRWLMNEIGGIANMHALNQKKASVLYSLIDQSDGFYQGKARIQDRSLMNVTFGLPTPDIERKFLEAATQAGFSGLAGHRAVGGIRASLYNGLTLEAAEALANLMDAFRRQT